MSLVLDLLAWAALLAGGFFAVVSAVGMHRMPDLFTRAHAASVNDTLGVGFLVLGMLLQTDDWAVGLRLVMILVILYVTGAATVHALARAALYDGQRPLLADPEGRLRPVDCAIIDPELAMRLSRPLVSQQAETDGEDATGGNPEREDPQWNS